MSSFLHRARLKIASLRSSSFLRNVGVISSGSALGHVFTLAAGPILTRVYGPKEFGALGLFTSALSVLGVAVTLQYEISIPVGRDEGEAAFLTIGSLLLSLPMSVIGGLLLWLLMAESWLGFGGLPWFTPFLLTLSLIFVGLFTALRYWSLREQQFKNIAQGVVVQSGARAILQTAIGAAGLHSSGLLLGETLGRCMGMTNMLRNSWPVLRRYTQPFRWKELFDALWRHRKFPLYSFPSSFLDALCLGLPLPLLIRMYGVSIGGYYSLVWKAITVPSVLVTVAVADTFHSRIAQFARDEPEKVMGLFRTASAGLLVTGLVPAAIVLIWGPRLFGWVFGARWVLSGTMAAILVPWYLAQFVVSPLSRVVVVLSGQEMKLAWDVLCLASLAGVFYVAYAHSFPPLATVKMLSGVYALLFVAYYLVLLNIIVRFDRSRNAAAKIV
jgi:O-antigen/teichoic acid export membrane protein